MAGWTRALGGLLIAAACTPAMAGPEGAQVVRGNVDITRNGAETLIRAGNNSIINYHSFNIAGNETVRFIQPSSSSRVLNRITTAAPTRIDGSLIANGRVYIVNPAGVIFGNGARVDVNALYAAGGKLSNADFLAGRDHFTGLTGKVENQGSITVQKFAGLVGQQVFNSGTINAPRGTVVMASGNDVMIGERTGNVFVKIQAPSGELKAGEGTANTGVVNASGGRVIMGAGDIYSIAVRAAGSVKARDISVQASGGNVQVAGSLDASNVQGSGGTIEVLGERISLVNAKLNATGQTGGGQVHVGGDFQGVGEREHAKVVSVDEGSTIDVSATEKGAGGAAIVWSDNLTTFQGTGLARGGAMGGDGGLIETSSKDVVQLDPAKIDAGSVDGDGGLWLIDPRNVRISTDATVEMTPAGGPPPSSFTPTTANLVTTSNVSVTDIQTSLNNGTSVLITTAQGGVAQAGNITVENSISKTAGGNATLTLRAQNDITINSGVTISATTGQLGVTLEANSGTGDTATGTGSVLLNGTINTNGGAFASSGVGYTQSSTGVVNTYSAGGAGSVTINHTGAVSLGGAVSGGATSVNSGGTISLGGSILTKGQAVTFQDAVVLTADAGVDTTNAGGTAAGANISFDSTLDATNAGTEGLSLRAGTGGDITFTGAVGTTRLGQLTISSANDVTANAITVAGLTQTAGTGTADYNGAVDSTGGLDITSVTVNVDGAMTASAGDISITGTNDLNINAKVTAATGDITVRSSTVTAAGALTINNNAGTGELDATAGDVTIVTNSLSITSDSATEDVITGGGNVTIRTADNRGIRIGAGGGGFMAITAATLEDRIAVVGGRVVTLGNSSTSAVEVESDLTLSNGLELLSAGDITFKAINPNQPDIQVASLSVHSGMDGSGNIVFEETTNILTDAAAFQAGNGLLAAATFTGANNLALRSIANTNAPATIAWSSDAAITDAKLPTLTIPGAGGVDYSIRSFGGTVTIGTAALVNNSDLTLQGGGSGVIVTPAISVASLTLLSNGSFTGAVTSADFVDVTGNATFSALVTTTGTFDVSGNATLGAGLTSGGTVTVGGTSTLTGTIATTNDDVNLNGNVVLGGNTTINSTGGDVTFVGTLQASGSGGQNLTINAGGGDVLVSGATGDGTTAHRLGDFDINGATNVTLQGVDAGVLELDPSVLGTINGNVTLSNRFLHSGTGRLDLAGNITSTNGLIQSTNLKLLNDVTLQATNDTTNGVVISAADLNGNDLDLVAQRIHLNGVAGSIAGTGTLTLRPSDATDSISIGSGSATAGNLLITTLSPLDATITAIHIGTTGGGVSHTIDVPATTFLSPVVFDAGSGTVNVNGDLSSAGLAITINGATSVAAPVTIATDSGDPAGAAINLNGAVTRSNALGALTLSAGTGGTITLGGNVGTAGAPLASFQITAADTVSAAGRDVFATAVAQLAANTASYGVLTAGSGNIDLDGGAITIAGAATSGGGTMTVTNSGLFTSTGNIALDGGFLQDGAGNTLFNRGGSAFTLSTNGGAITFTDDVQVIATGATFNAGAGTFTLLTNSSLNLATDATISANEIDLDSGPDSVFSTGTRRIILQPGADGFAVEVGSTDNTNLTRLDLTATDLAALGNFTAADAVTIGRATGAQTMVVNSGSFDSNVLFRGDASGTITIGAVTGTGTVSVDGGDITLGGDITGAGAVLLNGDITLGTSVTVTSSGASVTLAGTIDADALAVGDEDLTVDAATDVFLNGDVGGSEALGLFHVDNGHVRYNQDRSVTAATATFDGNVTATGSATNRDLTVNAATITMGGNINAIDGAVVLDGVTVTQNGNVTAGSYDATGTTLVDINGDLTVTGAVSLTGGDINQDGDVLQSGSYTATGGAIDINGDIDSDGAVTLDGATVTQDGLVTAADYALDADGAVAITSSITVDAGGAISIEAGKAGAGDLTFGAPSVVLTANDIELAAGNGSGVAVVNVRGNSPTFTGSSGAVSSFEVRQDGSMAGSDIADIAQFTGGIAGMSYILNAVNGSLAIDSAAAANVTGSRLDLSALDNIVTGGIAVGADLDLESLQTRAVVTYTGATVSASDTVTHDGQVRVSSGVVFKAKDLEFGAAVSAVGPGATLDIQTFTAGRDIFLGGDGTETGSGGADALHLTAAEITRLADGFSAIHIGGAANSGTITVKSNVTFKDALTLRASAPGGAVKIEQTLKNTTGDGSVTVLGSGATTTISGSIVTQGQTITINDRIVVLGSALLDSTDGGNTDAGAAVKLGFDAVSGDALDDAINAHSSGGDLTINAGTAGLVTLASVGQSQHLDSLAVTGGAGIELSSVETDGDQTYTGGVTLSDLLRSHIDGAITITGNLVVNGTATIRTAGDHATDDITITGTINADDALSNRDLTITVGAVDQSGAQGQVVVGGAIGGVQALSDLLISSDGTTMGASRTTGSQTFFGATRIGGNITGSRIDFNDALTLAADVVLTGTDLTSDAEQVELESVDSTGVVKTLIINALNTRINGDVGAVGKLASLTTDAAGRTRFMGSQVRTLGHQFYLDAVQLGNNISFTHDAGPMRFASTVVSFGGNHDLTANAISGDAVFFEGLVGGTTEGEKLRNLTTTGEGRVEFSANVRTTGAQTYDTAAVINGNLTFTAGSFEFKTIDSESAANRTLTLNTAGTLIVNGAIGQAGADTALGAFTADAGNMSFGGITVANAVNLDSTGNIAHTGDVTAGSYTAEGVTVSLRKLTTSGSQTVDGNITLNDDLTATGSGSITLDGAVTLAQDVTITTNNQSLSVSGAVNSSDGSHDLVVDVGTSTATFAADIGGTTALGSLDITATNATTRAVGTVGAQSYSGGLTTGFNHTATGAGDITITGVLTLTGDAVFTTANGNLLYNGGVSGGESLTSHAGGSGKFSRFTGPSSFQKLITEGDARIATTAVSASEEMDFKSGVLLETSSTLTAPKATFRGVIEGAGMNLTVNVSGQTDFQGAIGGAGALGSITTDAAGTTRIAANATTTSGMSFNDAVTIGGDIELRGGTGSLRFAKTIDSTPGTPFALSLFSDASANGTLANTPFVFGGSIGNANANTRLKSLTLSFQTDGNNVNRTAAPGATAFFGVINGDGTVAKGTDFRINTTQAFTMKPGQKLTSLGNLFINATNSGTVTLGDLTALGNITVTAGVVNIQLRAGAPVKNNPNDLGVDMTATGDISFGAVIPTLLNRPGVTEKERVSFANNSGVFNILTGAATDQFLFLKKANPVVENSFKDNNLFAPLDLTASGVSGVNAATIIAGAIPRDSETREVATPVTVSAALRKDLELMGMEIKDLPIDDLIEFLVGRAFYRDVPLKAAPQPKDFRITVNRLSTPSVQAAVDAYKQLVFLPGEINRTESIRDTLALAWDAYSSQTQNPDGLGFREYLETKAASGGTGEAEALGFLNDTRMVFERLDELGLSPSESGIPKTKLLGEIRPPAMDEGQISAAVLGVQLSSR